MQHGGAPSTEGIDQAYGLVDEVGLDPHVSLAVHDEGELGPCPDLLIFDGTPDNGGHYGLGW